MLFINYWGDIFRFLLNHLQALPKIHQRGEMSRDNHNIKA